jgi:PAS domain S-box-containing protein
MPSLDNTSLVFCGMVVTFATSIGMAITQWTRKTYPGFAYWTVGEFCRTLGFLFYATAPGHSPLIILGTCFDSANLIVNNRGLLVFRGRHQAHYRWEILLALLWTSLFVYFTYRQQINNRVMLYSLYHCGYYGWGAFILLTRRPAYAGSGDVLLTTSLVVWTLLDLTRGIYVGLFSPPVAHAIAAHPLTSIYAIFVMVLALMIALGRIMMNAQRLEYDYHAAQLNLEEDIVRREKYEHELEGYRGHLEELIEVRTAALSQSESKFRALVEQSLVGIYIYQDYFIRYANQTLCQMLGYASAEALVGSVPTINIIAPPNRFSVLKRIRRISRGLDEESTFSIGLLRTDGGTVDVEVRSRPIEYAGQPATIGVVIDVSERNRATKNFRALASRLQSVREEERSRIARDNHDDLGQSMTALKMKTVWLKKQLSPASVEENLAGIAEMEQMIAQIIQSVHDISWALRPGVLDTLGLPAAIEWLGKDFQRRAGIRCHLNLRAKHVHLDNDRATQIFRICQELLTNVIRHSRASHVELTLKFDKSGRLLLAVKDDGIGMGDTKPGSQSLGLLGMRERVNELGGEIDILSTPKLRGTCIRVRVPCSVGANFSNCNKCDKCKEPSQ